MSIWACLTPDLAGIAPTVKVAIIGAIYLLYQLCKGKRWGNSWCRIQQQSRLEKKKIGMRQASGAVEEC